MRFAIIVLAIALTACGHGMTAKEKEKAASDAADVAEVRSNQKAPAEAIKPQAIRYPDIEKNKLFGAGCNFLPKGGGMGAIAMAQADAGFMKQDDEIVRFAADKGSAQHPLLSWRKYDGRNLSFTLDLDQGKGAQSGMETVNFPAKLTVRDGADRVVYESEGSAQCGS